jgi:hypothetical protein
MLTPVIKVSFSNRYEINYLPILITKMVRIDVQWGCLSIFFFLLIATFPVRAFKISTIKAASGLNYANRVITWGHAQQLLYGPPLSYQL